MQDFTIKRTVAGTTSSVYLLSGSANGGYTFHDMFIDGNGLAGSGVQNRFISGKNSDAYNMVVWDFTGTDGTGFKVSALTGSGFIVSNITAYNCDHNFNLNNKIIPINNISSLSGISECYQNLTGTVGNNCISTDATIPASGSDNHISVTIGDEVVSTDDTNGTDFMFPKASGNMDNGGNTTHESATGMKGTTWAASSPSIGAFQIVSASTAFTFYYYNLLMAG